MYLQCIHERQCFEAHLGFVRQYILCGSWKQRPDFVLGEIWTNVYSLQIGKQLQTKRQIAPKSDFVKQ